MPEITRIENKTFEYDLPDEYLHLTNDLQRKGTWSYSGPRYLWIFADATTKKIISRFHYTERDNGADVPTPAGQIKVLVDAEVNPLISAMIHNEHNYATLPQKVDILPDGSTYSTPDPQAPDHTYELNEIKWNEETAEFEFTYPDCWKKPHTTWDDLIKWRNQLLSTTDTRIQKAMPNKIAMWEEYRQILRDIPAVFAGVDPWKVPFPSDPEREELPPTDPPINQPGV